MLFMTRLSVRVARLLIMESRRRLPMLSRGTRLGLDAERIGCT